MKLVERWNMSEEKPLLFVRKASGLTRAISAWTVIFFGLAVGFMPWHYFIISALPTWYPGINLPFVYIFGGLLVVIECLGMALISVAIPRSGAIYVPLSRATSPMLGMMEAWRSIITNPTQRGVTAFLGAGQLATFLTVTGIITNNPGLQDIGSTMAANVWLLVGIGLIFQVVGFLIDVLGPGIMGKWMGIWGIGALFGILTVNALYLGTSSAALQTRWDATFGTGAYNEIVTVSNTHGFQPAPLDWGVTFSSLLIPVANTWPYTVQPVIGEVQRPRRNIPFSMVGSAVVLLVINSLSAYNLTSTYGEFARRYAFVWATPAAAAEVNINVNLPMDISGFSAVLTPNATLSAIASFAPQFSNFADMVGNCYYCSRPLFAIGMDRMGPEVFTRTHPRFHSPWVGSLFWFLWSLITLTLSAQYSGTVSSVVFGITFVYSLARMWHAWSEIELPFSRPEIWKQGFAWTIAGLPVMTIIGAFAGSMHLYLLATLTANPLDSGMFIWLLYFFGALMFGYYALKNQKRGVPPSKIYGELPPE